ncbi:MAG: glycoside hydrolase family 88 protein [Clostridiales bacterium]|uniref:Unsaturated chondroitin disaccharide hydrolase n=1 Tax=Robinsoniella peoriensis TaxID=180332 RepID=A0A4U8Q863_9FIRM|nr:glycoside hydrolase family 88 protein [Clostridiales bacterium]TLD01132.1 Unsaturated chondroitin disaccharide hydrolase [Robinsoniella peoriensis]
MEKLKVQKAAAQALSILKGNLNNYTYKFPGSNSEHLFYPETENTEWTTGFCTGTYWLAYELTAEGSFRSAAEVQVESFYNRIKQKIDVDHHDMGFLYTPSCVAAYQITGNKRAKEAAILAADQLISRFQVKGEFLQAWGEPGAEDNYRLIIDCLLNLPLLYWASRVTGDGKYRDAAVRHTKTSIQNLVREDNSTYHTYFLIRGPESRYGGLRLRDIRMILPGREGRPGEYMARHWHGGIQKMKPAENCSAK